MSFTVYVCPDCGERADAAFYGPDGERGHYHDDPANTLNAARIFHPAVLVETYSLDEIRERLTGAAAIEADAKARWFGEPNHDARKQSLAGLTSALDASFPTQPSSTEEGK